VLGKIKTKFLSRRIDLSLATPTDGVGTFCGEMGAVLRQTCSMKALSFAQIKTKNRASVLI
jgi:hypothetical protein